MWLLIDGYNLLHHSDQLGRGRGVGWLERARRRLLRALKQKLDTELRRETCIVFDAAQAPAGCAPRQVVHDMDIRFAVDAPEADDLLEILIAKHAAPARLTVISSDHRVQNAAQRRRAKWHDADRWYEQLDVAGPQLAFHWPSPRLQATANTPEPADKPSSGLTAAETAAWLEAFQVDAADLTDLDLTPPKKQRKPAAPPRRQKPARPQPPSSPESTDRLPTAPLTPDPPSPNPRRQLDADARNPFPKGYGEDLL